MLPYLAEGRVIRNEIHFHFPVSCRDGRFYETLIHANDCWNIITLNSEDHNCSAQVDDLQFLGDHLTSEIKLA